MCVCFQLHTPIHPETIFTAKRPKAEHGPSAAAVPPTCRDRPGRGREPVLTRACSSHDAHRLSALDVQVEPVQDEGRAVPVPHPIVSERDLPAAGPVLGTGPGWEGLGAFRSTGLQSREPWRLIRAFAFPFVHSFARFQVREFMADSVSGGSALTLTRLTCPWERGDEEEETRARRQNRGCDRV